MKIIDAYWEKQNIGESVIECSIEHGDSIEELKARLDKIDASYQVVKIPVGEFEYSTILSKYGFSYIETMVTLVRDMRPVEIAEKRKLLNDKMYFEKMDEKSFKKMIEAVSNGLYHTDRISLDPYFSKEQASNRYRNWLKSEWDNKNEFYKLMSGDDYVGYLDLKCITDKAYQDVLTGIFPEYQGKGFAMGFTTKLVDMLRDRGAEKVYGDISTNNMPSLQSRLRYGYLIDNMSYVFVKHNEVLK